MQAADGFAVDWINMIDLVARRAISVKLCYFFFVLGGQVPVKDSGFYPANGSKGSFIGPAFTVLGSIDFGVS